MHSTFEWMSWSQLTILRLMRLSLTNDGALWCSRIELSIGILKVVCLSKGKGKGCQCHSVVWAHGRNECSWKTKIMICMLGFYFMVHSFQCIVGLRNDMHGFLNVCRVEFVSQHLTDGLKLMSTALFCPCSSGWHDGLFCCLQQIEWRRDGHHWQEHCQCYGRDFTN